VRARFAVVIRADDLSFELARAVLDQVGPEEVPVLDALGLEFVEASSAPAGGDGALGFDVGQMTMAVAAASVAVAAKDYLISVTSQYASDEGANALRRLVKYLRRKRDAGSGSKDDSVDGNLAFADAELAEVRRRTFEHARGLGLSEAKAQLLADAVSGALPGSQ
jgi:hypothetical protein